MDGRLEDVFVGVFAKRLAPTEIAAKGVSKTQAIQVGKATELLGKPSDKKHFKCRFVRVTDEYDSAEFVTRVTLSDTRRNQPKRSPEWRLDYGRNQTIMKLAEVGDYCWIARHKADPDLLTLVMAPADTEVGARLDRIFGTDLSATGEESRGTRFSAGSLTSGGKAGVDAEDAELFDLLGVPIKYQHEYLLGPLLDRIEGEKVSPKSGMVSVKAFAQAILDITPMINPLDADDAILSWVEIANELFFAYEKYLRAPDIAAFANSSSLSIEEFLTLAKQMLNTRKSRAGGTLEFFIEHVLRENGLSFTTGAVVRKEVDGTKPDFLFPSVEAYLNDNFPDELLTYLGSKTTLKERWMQVLAEGDRIPIKHLATVDRDLSEDVLKRMERKGVIPIIPEPILQSRYSGKTNSALSFKDFISLVSARQSAAASQKYLSKF